MEKYKCIHSFPEGEHAIDMIEYKGRIIVATNKDVYYITENHKLKRLKIEYKEGGEKTGN